MSARTGRRPGPNATREAILAAATRQFAVQGYDRTTMRSIATEAGVDPALVLRFYNSKHQLFLLVATLPFDTEELIAELSNGKRGLVGERLARFTVGLFETDDARARITSLLRAAMTEQVASEMLKDLLTEKLFRPLADALGVDHAELRANLVGSQVVGMLISRYVVGLEPLASLPSEAAIRLFAPTLQRYLTHDLAL